MSDHEIEYDLCRACRNDKGEQNREVKGGYCNKIICDNGEFKGANGTCYSCLEPKAISVNADSGCEEVACGREVKDGKCQIKECAPPTYVKAPNGDCYRCDDTELFQLDQETCESGCPQRRYTSLGWCKLNTCTLGVSFPLSSATGCYPCEGYYDGSGVSGTSDYAIEYCEACNGYVASSGWCYNKESCSRGSEFRATNATLYRFCTNCAITSKVLMEDHP